MYIVCLYLDFLARSFDAKSRVSRKGFFLTVLLNAALSALLVGVGLVIPKGRPLQFYIAFSSLVSTPLIPAYITLILRRLNDVGKSRLFALLMLVPAGLGMIPLFILCGQRSAYGTEDDLTTYRSLTDGFRVLFGALKNVMAIYPFVYLIYIAIKLLTRSGLPGPNAALFSINLLICVLTVLGVFRPGVQGAIPFLSTLRKLTILSNAMLTIILYQNTQNALEAVMIVYLYFYVIISPAAMLADAVKAVRAKLKDRRARR